MCNSTETQDLATTCARPRRSKLRRLQNLQKKLRTKQASSRSLNKVSSRKHKETSSDADSITLPKRQKSKESDVNSTATAAQKITDKLDVTADVEALRKQLQLSVEEDPYGDCPAPIRNFDELQTLPPHVLQSLQRHGITSPMPIQAQALPLVLSGRDVIGLAQTGSGKTMAFLLPAAVYLEKQKQAWKDWSKAPSPSVLVLAPTRELAVQISDEANKVFDGASKSSSSSAVNTVAVYGGGDKFKQQKQLQWGADIVVATPGRLTDFVESKAISLSEVTYLVLDEADRMLDMGFHDDVAAFAKQVKPERQVLFFSATWNKEVQQLAQGLCRKESKPVRISYGQGCDSAAEGAKHKAREGITQEVVVVDHSGDDHWERQEAEKDTLMEKHLKEVLNASDEHKVLVFVSRKDLADKLSNKLYSQGFKVDAMHGGKAQDRRLWVLDQFRKGELRLLVCTDVLGRGIDIPKVSHVVIHEMGDIEDYIHRIGRTARGQYGKGHALVFFEYWDNNPQLAADLIGVLAASKQHVPPQLQRIADEVASGKRVSQADAGWNGGKEQWKASFSKQGNKWNTWG